MIDEQRLRLRMVDEMKSVKDDIAELDACWQNVVRDIGDMGDDYTSVAKQINDIKSKLHEERARMRALKSAWDHIVECSS